VTASIVELTTPRRKSSNSKPLTVLRVKNHKSGVLSDAHPYKGLRIRANKNGSKTWMYRYRAGEKLKQIKLGTYPGMDLAEAREKFIDQRRLKEDHQDPRQVAEKKKEDSRQSLLDASKSEYTLGAMVEHYLTEKVEKDRKPKGAYEVRRLFERDIQEISDIPASEIEADYLHEFIIKIANRAPDVARVFRAELARAWRFAANTGRTKSPCLINSDTGGKLKQGKRERSLSKEEICLLLPWIHNYSRTVEDILTLTLYLGLRSGEVCKLRDDWLNEEGGQWWLTIPASEMKKDHSNHRVPLVGTAMAIAKRRSGRGLLFPSRAGGPVKQKILGVEVYAHSGSSKAATYKGNSICPVKSWAPNDLRKTTRTHLAKLGCPYEVGEAVLHHKLPGVAGLYNQYTYDDEKLEWLNKVGRYFDELNDSSLSGGFYD
jgi:integrase